MRKEIFSCRIIVLTSQKKCFFRWNLYFSSWKKCFSTQKNNLSNWNWNLPDGKNVSPAGKNFFTLFLSLFHFTTCLLKNSRLKFLASLKSFIIIRAKIDTTVGSMDDGTNEYIATFASTDIYKLAYILRPSVTRQWPTLTKKNLH